MPDPVPNNGLNLPHLVDEINSRPRIQFITQLTLAVFGIQHLLKNFANPLQVEARPIEPDPKQTVIATRALPPPGRLTDDEELARLLDLAFGRHSLVELNDMLTNLSRRDVVCLGTNFNNGDEIMTSLQIIQQLSKDQERGAVLALDFLPETMQTCIDEIYACDNLPTSTAVSQIFKHPDFIARFGQSPVDGTYSATSLAMTKLLTYALESKIPIVCLGMTEDERMTRRTGSEELISAQSRHWVDIASQLHSSSKEKLVFVVADSTVINSNRELGSSLPAAFATAWPFDNIGTVNQGTLFLDEDIHKLAGDKTIIVSQAQHYGLTTRPVDFSKSPDELNHFSHPPDFIIVNHPVFH